MSRPPRHEAPTGPLEPLMGIDDWARVLSASRRTVERLRAAGKLPKPDCHVGWMPRWQPSTVRRWIEQGGQA
jgi:hypothetical protein